VVPERLFIPLYEDVILWHLQLLWGLGVYLGC